MAQGRPVLPAARQAPGVILSRIGRDVNGCQAVGLRAPRLQGAGDFLRPSAHDVFHAARGVPRVPHRRVLWRMGGRTMSRWHTEGLSVHPD